MVGLYLCGCFLIQSSRWRSLWKDCNYFDHFLEGIYKSCVLRYPSGFLEIVLISRASSVSHLYFFFICTSGKMMKSKQIKEAKLLTTSIGGQLNRRLVCCTSIQSVSTILLSGLRIQHAVQVAAVTSQLLLTTESCCIKQAWLLIRHCGKFQPEAQHLFRCAVEMS